MRETNENGMHISANCYSEELLERKLDELIPTVIKGAYDTESTVRRIYDYVHESISYVPTSDKSDVRRAAYDALFVSGEGDCFSYFAASKVMFDRLGIENLDIEREKSDPSDMSHYWSLVNIGSADHPRWYHYDATRLAGEYSHSGCLLTDKQIEAYNKVRPDFRKYNKEKTPSTEFEIITRTAVLEAFY